MLEISDLSCARGDRTLFAGLSARVGAGELLHIAGSNGSGKTTLLRTLCGLARPAFGDICWDGEPTRALGDEFRRSLSYVGHHDGVQGELTPFENLQAYRCVDRSAGSPSPLPLLMNLRPKAALEPFPLPSGEGGPKGRVREETARSMGIIRGNRFWSDGLSRRESGTSSVGGSSHEETLHRLGLAPYRSFPAKILSQGQRRRLALARVLVANKPLWILDEPFTALDLHSCRLISELLAQHLARGGMAVVASHQDIDIPEANRNRIDLDTLRAPSHFQVTPSISPEQHPA